MQSKVSPTDQLVAVQEINHVVCLVGSEAADKYSMDNDGFSGEYVYHRPVTVVLVLLDVVPERRHRAILPLLQNV
ncbi:hypothetical protein FHT86_006972 [Rhizobium sp. BK313]|nr:hypothetical protein [Rhizobium sp. BK313]